MRFITGTLTALACLAAPLPAQRIQAPDAPWKTIQTVHYRIHYPVRGGFEPFAMEIASKIEGIHTRVSEWVGYESPKVVEVLLRDPRMEGNGFAYPLLDHPFVELWRTPPESDSGIAHFTTWPEMLVTHELAHIHHLTRPLGNPRFLDKVLDLPVGPVTLKAPRWVIEGYATVIEGRVTGSGRPHGVHRAALLREWAREGKLPDYGELNGFGGFRGGSMAYLVGSAYLEWLERTEMARTGEKDVLKKLWRKLAAHRKPGFNAVFLRTFGFTAEDGYDRFRSELSADALGLERRMKEQHLTREGEVFTKVDGEVTELAVNPDGTRLLARVLTPTFKGLRVWDLREPVKPKPGFKHPKVADPDVAPLKPTKPAAWELGRRNGAIPEKPFWTKAQAMSDPTKQERKPGSIPQQDFIAFSVREPDEEGTLRRRAKTWQPGTPKVAGIAAGSAARLEKSTGFRTVESDGLGSIWTVPPGEPGRPGLESTSIPVVRTPASARLPSPAPDGKTLYYVQLGATGCEIRRLDLTLAPLTPVPVPWGDSFFAVDAVRPRPDEASQLPPPLAPPPAHDYAVGETMRAGFRSGLTLAPSGESVELGFGGSDLLGRLSWQVLAAAGDAAGPRGAQASMVYRGWRWVPGFQVFSSLERPSSQRRGRVEGFDRQRTGCAVEFAYESKNTAPAFFKPTLSFERVLFKEAPNLRASRGLLGLDFGISRFWNRGEAWGVRLSARAKDGVGRTDGNRWQLQSGSVQVRIFTPWTQLALKAESARVTGDPTPLDRLHLGGLGTSLAPLGLDWNRAEQPALPSYAAIGDRLHRLRAEAGSALCAYVEHVAVWDHTQSRPAYTKVAGLELDLMRLIGNTEFIDRVVGPMTFVAGIHRVLKDGSQGEAMQGRSIATLSIVLRP
ncbi:MAG: hypothetical protein IPQ13_03990 [Holophagaceae bacterium]|nr:hypothetical protein [Holophagaceae bacterium]